MSSPYLLDRAETVLCIVDIQEKLAGRMDERERVVSQARTLVLSARRLELPIIVTEQYPRGIGATAPELRQALGEDYAPIEKLCFGCAGEPAFMERLKPLKRRQVVLCGMEAHICVLQTCLELLDRNYRVHVVADAICSRQVEHKQIGIEQMRQAGAVITCAEAAIFQMLGKAGTPEFKDLLNLIK